MNHLEYLNHQHYQTEDLIPIVADLAAGYTGSDHSSITYEAAQGLMEAVLYCIHEFEVSEADGLLAGAVPAKEAYRLGGRLVLKKVRYLHSLYDRLTADFDHYGSQCLEDTIIKGIPQFLLRYDAKYAPQETLLTLDYPILKNIDSLCGADAVFEYVTCVSFEQQFLKKFDRPYIIRTLRASCSSYETFMENICAPVLQNVIGRMILKKPLNSGSFSDDEYKHMEEVLRSQPISRLEPALSNMIRFLTEQYFNRDMLLFDYLSSATACMAARIRAGLESGSLKTVFTF